MDRSEHRAPASPRGPRPPAAAPAVWAALLLLAIPTASHGDGVGTALASPLSLQWVVLLVSLAVVGLVTEQLHRVRRRAVDDLRVLEQAEASLREEAVLQQRLARIADTAPGTIYAFRLRPDGTSCFPYASPSIVRLLGLRPEDLLEDASPAFALMPAEDAARLHRSIAESARRLTPWRDEFRIRAPDGQERWLEGHSLPERDPAGGVLWHGFIADVTDRKRTEQALRESEERFRQLAETIREVFWLYDCAAGRVVYVSPAYETIWGRDREGLYRHGDAWFDAIHPDDRDRAAGARQMSGEYDEMYRVVRPDGSTRWVHDRAFPVRDAAGRVIRVAGVAEDVTDRLRLEEQLRQTQKLESIGQLAGGVAHDFNNLLTVITSSADVLATELPPTGDAQELLQEIQHASRRGAALTRQLLAFSRREVVEPRVTSLSAVIGDTEKMLRRLIGEDVLLETRLSGSCVVRIDPGQWTQVLVNLAVNARDAMSKGGRLSLTTAETTVDAAFHKTHPALAPGRYVVLTVADTGCGMPAEVRSRVFEPFFTTKGIGHGTGLGLAVVYGIVEQSGGHVEVASEPGAGTTFTFYLPALADEPDPPEEIAAAGEGRGGETVLLVEDEEPVRKLAARVLEASGYRVYSATDGVDALRILATPNGTIDLLLTDVVMPNMGGPELAEEVRARYPEVKVLFASGYLDDAVVRRGVEAAEVAFLQKPYEPTVLRRRVREVLDAAPSPAAS